MTLNGTATEPLLLDRDGPVATLTINRPDRLNALTFGMFARLPTLLAEAAAAGGVRALVVRGAGQKAFSAGADISEFESTRSTREQTAAYDDAVLAAEEALATFPAPTIAAIGGYCYGGGCGLALACDIRFAAPGARFAITPAKLGLVYPLRSTKRLVDEVHDDLDQAVYEFTTLLAARSGVTQRAVKRTVARILDGVTTDDEAHAELRASSLAAPDYAEGIRAFLERRPPVFE
jgi:enoyl-CoA hydratase/carnithine racemase